MKISILLPYKEDYTKNYAGAVSIHVSNLLKHSVYKRDTFIYMHAMDIPCLYNFS